MPSRSGHTHDAGEGSRVVKDRKGLELLKLQKRLRARGTYGVAVAPKDH
jgi:hypothetical protein